MEHIYILVIWTVVAIQGQGTGNYNMHRERDWRPIGEFHMEEGRMNKKTAKEMCEEAARQLALKPENYRCVRSK
jgi:hypothetical protein